MADRQTNFILKGKDAASGPIGRVARSLRNVEKQAKRLGGRTLSGIRHGITAIGKAAVFAAGVGLVALAGAFVGAVVKAAAFEKAMLNVNSIAKATPVEFDKMRASVLAISRELPQTAETLAQGLYDIASSGFAGAEGITVLQAAAKAASAGLSTTADSARGITAVLNAYHLGADKAQYVSDVLFKVVDRGVVTFGELANEIGDVTSIAPLLGVSLEEVGAAIAVMTKHGINAAESTTALSGLLRSILSPSKEATKKAKELGIEWSVAALQAKGLAGFMEDLVVAAGDDEEALATLAGDARAIKSLFILAANGGKEFTAELALMKDAAGATDTALSYQKQGLSFQLEILKNNVSAAAIAIGEKLIPKITPLIVELSEFVTVLVGTKQPFDRFRHGLQESEENLSPLNKKLAEWGPLGAIVGAVLYSLREGFRQLKDIWDKIGPTVGRIVAAVMGPGGLNDSIREIYGQIGTWLIPKVKALIHTFVGPGGVVESVRKVVAPILANLIPALGKIVTSLFGGDGKTGLVPALGKLVGTLWGDGKGPLAGALKGAGALLGTFLFVLEKIIDVITFLIEKVNALVLAMKKLPLIGGGSTSLPSAGYLSGFFGGGYAAGGPVSARVPILVGEKGPEAFIPNTAGRIVPNDDLGSGGGGGSSFGGLVVNFNSIWPPTAIQAREIARVVSRELYYSRSGSSRFPRG